MSKFARVSRLLDIGAQLINHDVREAFSHRTDPFGQAMMKEFTVNPAEDSIQILTLVLVLFYIACGRMTRDSAQVFTEGTRVLQKAPTIVGEVRLKPSKEYIYGVQTGYYRINVPHMLDGSQKHIDGYHQAFGNVTTLYVFGDRRQIKINTTDEQEGHRCMNLLLKLVDPKVLNGTSEEHSYVSRRGKNRKKHRLEGLTGTANQIKVKFPDRTSQTYQL